MTEEEEVPPVEEDPRSPDFAHDIEALKANATETQDAIDNIRSDISDVHRSSRIPVQDRV